MKKFTQYARGFTLIELLVVIAIIGILSSVVLVSLNSARSKGKDARIISSVAQTRNIAERLFTGNYGSSAFVTPTNPDETCTAVTNVDSDLRTLDVDVRQQLGSATGCDVAATAAKGIKIVKSVAADSIGADTGYVAWAPLTTANTYTCVSSTGISKSTFTNSGSVPTTYSGWTGSGWCSQ